MARTESLSSNRKGFSTGELWSLDSLSSVSFKGLYSTSVGPFSVARELLPTDGCSGDCLLKSKAKEWSGDPVLLHPQHRNRDLLQFLELSF